MWTFIAQKILRYRILIVVVIGMITVFMAYEGQKIEMAYEHISMLPKTDSVFIQNEAFTKHFPKSDNILIIGVQTPHFLDSSFFFQWRDYCKNLEAINGVGAMLSATQSYNLYKNTELKHFELQKIFPDSIQTAAQLDTASQLFYSLPFYRDRFYNPKTNAWMMAVTLNQHVIYSDQRDQLIHSIDSLSQQFTQKTQVKVHLSGLPYIRVTMASMLSKELRMFVLLALLVTTIVLALFFKSFKVVFFTIIVVIVAVIWSLGIMALFGYKITMIASMIPPLLIVIGVPNSIFLVNKYLQSYTKSHNKFLSLARSVSKVGNATFLTNLTTALGFATFITTRSVVLVEFGELAFVCIMCLYVLDILLIPIIFSFASPPNSRHTRHLRSKRIQGILNFIIHSVVEKRNYIYVAALIITMVCVFGIKQMYVSGYMIDDIPKSDQLITNLEFFENNFEGLMPLEILVDTKKKQGAFDLNTIKSINDFQNDLLTWKNISKPISLVELIKFSRQAYLGGGQQYYDIPANKQELAFMARYVPKGDATATIGLLNFTDSSKQVVRLSYRVADLGNADMAIFLKKLHKEIDQRLPNNKYIITLAGTSYVHFHGTNYLIKNLFMSVALAISLIALFMSWMFRSKRMVLVVLIPNLLPLFITAAIMGYFGIPMKYSTILVFSIAFGISVDDSIHFLAKYRQELKETRWNIKESVVRAIQESGQSMIYTSVILFFGFGIFAASSFGGTAALGVLIAITLMFAMFCNLLLLPSLLLTFDKLITNRRFKKPSLEILVDGEDDHEERIKRNKRRTKN